MSHSEHDPSTISKVTNDAPADPVGLYLDLLTRCITNTIYRDPGQFQGKPPAYDETVRREGWDWPETAHSMVGIKRLNNIADLSRTVLVENVPGDFIETGVWRGGVCILMRGALKAYGDTRRKVYVADSFQGLPPPDEKNYPADAGQNIHTFTFLSVSQEQVADNFRAYGLLDEQVVFVKGWFKDTLPTLAAESFSLVRLDGDLYESTIQGLENLYPKLSAGGFLVVDDYGSWPTCKQAVDDYRAAHKIDDPIIPVDAAGVYWRKSG